MRNFSLLRNRTAAVVTGAVVIVGLGTTSGYAASMITSAQIANNTITAADIQSGAVRSNELADGTVRLADLNDTTMQGMRGEPGLANVIAGAGYTQVWKAGSYGESIETCPEGQNAIGGGYSTFGGYNGMHDGYDLGGANTDIQVTVSAPYFKGDYVPVDDAGNFRADQWVVRGFNHGNTDQVVRAWVVCANVAQ